MDVEREKTDGKVWKRCRGSEDVQREDGWVESAGEYAGGIYIP
jgi:hypothetical protein